jgi:hypothetical protein
MLFAATKLAKLGGMPGGRGGRPRRHPLRMGPADDWARGPVGTLGISGMVCLTGTAARSKVRLIWSTTLDGAGYGAAAARAEEGGCALIPYRCVRSRDCSYVLVSSSSSCMIWSRASCPFRYDACAAAAVASCSTWSKSQSVKAGSKSSPISSVSSVLICSFVFAFPSFVGVRISYTTDRYHYRYKLAEISDH